MIKADRGKEILCRLCRHFYITHEPVHPNGCRAYGFKSRRWPFMVVKESSGEDCKLFTKRVQSSRK